MARKPNAGPASDPELLILASLANGSRHGYAMMQDIESFSGTRLGPGTL
jgi:DNA-binding PadR family transcriptional regulator